MQALGAFGAFSSGERWTTLPGMRFQVLGPLEVETDNGPVVLGGQKERLLLAQLLTRPNQVVPVETLVRGLWGEQPPPTAVKTLQSHVKRLRQALEPGRPRGAAGEVLITRQPGYLLRVSPGALDATRFEELTAGGRPGQGPRVQPGRLAAGHRHLGMDRAGPPLGRSRGSGSGGPGTVRPRPRGDGGRVLHRRTDPGHPVRRQGRRARPRQCLPDPLRCRQRPQPEGTGPHLCAWRRRPARLPGRRPPGRRQRRGGPGGGGRHLPAATPRPPQVGATTALRRRPEPTRRKDPGVVVRGWPDRAPRSGRRTAAAGRSGRRGRLVDPVQPRRNDPGHRRRWHGQDLGRRFRAASRDLPGPRGPRGGPAVQPRRPNPLLGGQQERHRLGPGRLQPARAAALLVHWPLPLQPHPHLPTRPCGQPGRHPPGRARAHRTRPPHAARPSRPATGTATPGARGRPDLGDGVQPRRQATGGGR
jgi:hypothetical protein